MKASASTGTRKTGFENNPDRQLELKFLPIIASVLGRYFFVQDDSEDLLRGSDFVVLHGENIRCAARLRRTGNQYFNNQWLEEFSIRWSRPSGVETEIHKINKDYVNQIFYGFVNPEETKIIQYFIGDLKLFKQLKVKPFLIKNNYDNSSEMALYKINQFPAKFILKRWP